MPAEIMNEDDGKPGPGLIKKPKLEHYYWLVLVM